ncbi:hypothetical protein Tco_1317854 [Tanacetum coccineum]
MVLPDNQGSSPKSVFDDKAFEDSSNESDFDVDLYLNDEEDNVVVPQTPSEEPSIVENGVTRPKKYFELSATEALQAESPGTLVKNSTSHARTSLTKPGKGSVKLSDKFDIKILLALVSNSSDDPVSLFTTHQIHTKTLNFKPKFLHHHLHGNGSTYQFSTILKISISNLFQSLSSNDYPVIYSPQHLSPSSSILNWNILPQLINNSEFSHQE